MPLLQVGWGRFFFFFFANCAWGNSHTSSTEPSYTGDVGDTFVPSATPAKDLAVVYNPGLYSGPLIDEQNPNGYRYGPSSVNNATTNLASDGGSYALHAVQGAHGFRGYTQPATNARGQISGYEFPNIYGHGNTPWLPMNASGSNFIEPHVSPNSAINPIIPRLSATNDAQSQFDVGGFAAMNGYSNNYLPTMTPYGSDFMISYGPDFMIPYGPDFITHPQLIPNGIITTTGLCPQTPTPSIPLMNPGPAVPPATPPAPAGARSACMVCGRSFGRPFDLKRHGKKHVPGPKKFGCPSEGCRYTGAMGFTRKDKMKDHVKNMHLDIDVRYL